MDHRNYQKLRDKNFVDIIWSHFEDEAEENEDYEMQAGLEIIAYGALGMFIWVEALRPSHNFFNHIRTSSWVEPVLSNEDEVSCSRTQHHAPGEIPTCDLAIKSPALYQLT